MTATALLADSSAAAPKRHRVVPSSILHVKALVRTMRRDAHVTVTGAGYDPRRALHRTMRQSHHCRTALIDGRPVAMWGVVGALLAERASVWLVMAEGVTSMPRSIVREAEAQLAEIRRHYSEIVVTILPEDETALRFAIYLGFRDRHDGNDRRDRKAVERRIRTNPKNRVPLADGYVIALGYHPEKC